MFDRYVCLGLLCWLLKDAAWVTLLPTAAFLAAFAAILVESHSFIMRFHVETTAQRVHGAATFVWLFGNTVWMVSEFLFEPVTEPGSQMPWYDAPLAVSSLLAYNGGLHIARGILIAGLALLALFYAKSATESPRLDVDSAVTENPQETTASANPQDQDVEGKDVPQPLVFGICSPEVYQWIFIGPWILKDIFWSLEMFWPAMTCGLVVLALTADCVFRFGGFILSAEVFWVIGNMVWIYGELVLQDTEHWPRFSSASFMGLGILCVLSALRQTWKLDASDGETAHLLGAAPRA